MMTLEDLWVDPLPTPEITAPAQRRSKASRAGADSMSQDVLTGQAGRVIAAVVASMSSKDRAPGLTREEIADITGLRDTSVCGRVSELMKAGNLQEPGIYRTGSAGRAQGVLWAGACTMGEPITCVCKDCGGGASSRLWYLPERGYLTVRKCEQAGCLWWEVV